MSPVWRSTPQTSRRGSGTAHFPRRAEGSAQRCDEVALLAGGKVNRQQPAFSPLDDGPLKFARRKDLNLAEVQFLGQDTSMRWIGRSWTCSSTRLCIVRSYCERPSSVCTSAVVFAARGSAASRTANGIAAKRYA